MVEEARVVISSGKKMRFAGIDLPISDPNNVQVVFADLITEAREFNGVVSLSFGTIINDAANGPEIVTCSRLRITTATAADLRNSLDQTLKSVMPGKGTGN